MSSDKSRKRAGKGARRRQNQAANKGQTPARKVVDKVASGAPKASTRTPAPAKEYEFADEEVKVTEPVAPLFERVDWRVFWITTFMVMFGYYFTLAPDLTLEDSGELAVGSMYAGVPHPPGYPVWTIYTWLFTKLVPFSNIAWRVALSSAVAGALSCGFIAMMVSRGVRSMYGLFDMFKELDQDAGEKISMVSGYVAGMLMAFNGFMWSQAVIVEVYTLSVLTLVLQMINLMRWMHAPHRYRYLWYSFFWGGIAFTNHQTLVVAMIGTLIAVLMRRTATGRDLFCVAAVFFLLYAAAKIVSGPSLSPEQVAAIARKTGIFKFLLFVGLCGIVGGMVIAILTRNRMKTNYQTPPEAWIVSGVGLLGFIFGLAQMHAKGGLASTSNALMWLAFLVIGTFCVIIWTWGVLVTGRLFTEWWQTLVAYASWVVGALFYFYMPLAGVTNPPMQWGYPRIIEGFLHALFRGQYEKANPTSGLDRFVEQIGTYVGGAIEEFNLVYLTLAMIPVFVIYFRRMNEIQKLMLAIGSGLYGFVGLFLLITVKGWEAFERVGLGLIFGYFFLILAMVPVVFYFQNRKHPLRAWMGGVGAIYLFLSLLLLFLLNPQPDRQSQQLNRVFFTASYVPVSMFIGHGVALIAAVLVAQYRKWRLPILIFAFCASLVAVYNVFDYKDQYWVTRCTDLFGILLAMGLFWLLLFQDRELKLKPMLAIFALMPVFTFGTHWADNEQRGHMFGFWFGHDMFTPPYEDKEGKPLYPEMAKDAVLYGGTDPGRFCPTYMIFCESFIEPDQRHDPKFDRRDVYIITQNALADATYLNYIRAHYNRSAQIDASFFESATEYLENKSLDKVALDAKSRGEVYKSGLGAWGARQLKIFAKPLDKIFDSIGDSIEKSRRVGSSWFEPEHFTDIGKIRGSLRQADTPLAKYLKSKLSEDTLELLGETDNDWKLQKALAREFNQLLEEGPLYDAERFQGVEFTAKMQRFIKENPQGHTRIRLNRQLLEVSYPEAIEVSQGGVYPDVEMYISTPEASQQAFEQYVSDAQRRYEHDMRHPNEPKQIKPGEIVTYDPNSGRVSVSGQVAVMSINGLLTKDMFDKNPGLDFYVEESFPLDWMYPHLTPYGIIMKIERNHVPEFTQEIVDRDHEFWTRYSNRLIGDFIDYDTSVKEICDFIVRVHDDRIMNRYHYDLRLENVASTNDLPTAGRSQVILGKVGDKLHVRIFNDDQELIVDKADSELRPGHNLSYLRNLVKTNALPDVSNLSEDESRKILKSVASASGNSLLFGFTGDPKFIRDDNAKKAFSKLRSAIAGVYAWRVNYAVGRGNVAEQQRMIKEADFAFRQSFAFCPFSPEAVYRYTGLLMGLKRANDALRIVETFLRFDPNNGAVRTLRDNLIAQGAVIDDGPGGSLITRTPSAPTSPTAQLAPHEQRFMANPTNVSLGLQLYNAYLGLKDTNKAGQMMDRIVAASTDTKVLMHALQSYGSIGQTNKQVVTANKLVQTAMRDLRNPNANVDTLSWCAQAFNVTGQMAPLEQTMAKLSVMKPTDAETWFDLAGVQAVLNKTNQSLISLQKALQYSDARRKTNAAARDLRPLAAADKRFQKVRTMPAFKTL